MSSPSDSRCPHHRRLTRRPRFLLSLRPKPHRRHHLQLPILPQREDHAHTHRAVPWPHNPYNSRSIAREQITLRYPSVCFEYVTITHPAKKLLKKQHDSFEVLETERQNYQGKKLILATGSPDVFPDIEEFKEKWPQHIYQCLACDGFEQRGAPTGILDCSPKTVTSTIMVLNARITVLTNCAVPEIAAIKQQLQIYEAWGAKIAERKITRLVNNGLTYKDGVTVEFEESELLTLFSSHTGPPQRTGHST